ncbi:MAG: hypothetical protein WA354_08405 [Terracidiphilus sp.]
MIAEETVDAVTKIGEFTRNGATRDEVNAQTEGVPEARESGFLLDWLTGGEACQRNIQGFSSKFDTQNLVATP